MPRSPAGVRHKDHLGKLKPPKSLAALAPRSVTVCLGPNRLKKRRASIFSMLRSDRAIKGQAATEPRRPRGYVDYGFAVQHPDEAHSIIAGHRRNRIEAKQFVKSPAKGFGLPTPAIKEQARIIDELVPPITRNLRRRLSLQSSKCRSVDYWHAA